MSEPVKTLWGYEVRLTVAHPAGTVDITDCLTMDTYRTSPRMEVDLERAIHRVNDKGLTLEQKVDRLSDRLGRLEGRDR